MNKRFGIFLEPDKEFYNFILEWKSHFKKIADNQYYINEIPHLTLLHGIYKNEKILINEFKKFKYFEPIFFESAKPYIFYDDIEKNRNTLTYAFINNEKLINLQKELLSKFKPDYPYHFPNLTNPYLSNLENFNYPFVGSSLKPHVTIANNHLHKTHKEIKLFLSAPEYYSVKFTKLYIAEIENNIIKESYSFSL